MATVRELVTKIGFDVDTRALKDVDRRLKSIKKQSVQMAKGFVVAGLGVGVFLRQAGKMEQVEIAFTTMLGSAEAAQAKMAELFEFAAKTPFTIPGVVSSAKQLLAMGIEADSLLPTLKSLGDVSAGLSVPLSRLALNFGQVKAQGKLTGRELRDFAIAGVPLAAELSRMLGKTTSEIQNMVSTGDIGFDKVEQAFVNMTSAGGKFNNLMIKQSKSLFGILSNMQDFFIILAADIGKDLLPKAKEMASAFIDFVEANRKLIKTRVTKFIKVLVSFMEDVVFFGKAILFVLENVTKVVGGLENAVLLLIKAFMAMFALKLLGFMGALVLSVKALAAKWLFAGNAALVAQAKMLLLPILIGAAIVALFLIFEDMVRWWKGDKSITGVIVQSIKDMWPKIIDAFATGWQKVKDMSIVALESIADALQGNLIFSLLSNLFKGGKFVVEQIAKNSQDGPLSKFNTPPINGNTNNTSPTFNLNAPIQIDSTVPPEEIAPKIQQGLEQGLQKMLRDTLRTNSPALQF